ncbi:MAG: DUF3810 family protein [Vicinamibacterales bacterium]
MKRPGRFRGAGTLVLVSLAAAAAVVPLPAAGVERIYSRWIYPAIQHALTPIANKVPFALLDVAVGVLLLCAIVALVTRARSQEWVAAARFAGLWLIQATAVIYLLFVLLWGLNYRRVPLEDKLDFDRSRVTTAHAAEFAAEAVRRVNLLHGAAHALRPDRVELAGSFASAELMMLPKSDPPPPVTKTGRPKRSLLGVYFRRAAIDGMTDPFFLEVILNPDLLAVEEPEVLAHEWAHLAGYADESEANFLAWLTCLRGDGLAQYSGWLSAYLRVSSALPREMRSSLPKLDEGPRADIRAISARYNTSSAVVRRAATDVYDTYLKANRIREGIANYDAVIQLILGTTLGRDWSRH